MLEELGMPDFDVEKNRPSGFYGTYLETLLRDLGVETIIFSGFATNICVESTFRDAVMRDFRTIGIKEAMVAHDPCLQEASEKNMEIMGYCLAFDEFADLAKEVQVKKFE